MSEASKINDGAVGPPEKPVFNPKQEILSKELILQKAKKLGEKILYFVGVGMKRNVIIQKPDGKEIARVPLTLAIIIVILSQFLLLPIAAVLVVFFKWKIELEPPKPPTTSPPAAPPSAPTPTVSSTNPSGYSDPELPPMPT